MKDTMITYMGQAGYILESRSGTKVGIDLYLSDCVERENGYKRLMPHIVCSNELDLDYIVATHSHHDHFDIDAIPELMNNNKTILLTALDGKEYVEKMGLDQARVEYLKKGNCYWAKDILVEAVECDHGPQMPYAIGLLITIDGQRVYITGDTSLHLEFAEDILRNGIIDCMIAPINGTFGNMNEREAVELCKKINPCRIIPSHYWCFAEHGGDPGKFVECLKKESPKQKYQIMAMGETSIL